jgi:hypothetical protein
MTGGSNIPPVFYSSAVASIKMAVQTQRHPSQFLPAHCGDVSFPNAPRLIWGQMIGFANRMAIRVIIYAV